MNDFQMSHLAASRVDALSAEADRHRMARSAKPQHGSSKAERSYHPRRLSFRSFLRRAVA